MITAGQQTAARAAGVLYLVTFLVVVVTNFAIHDTPMALFEIFTSVWLLTKGLRDAAGQ